MGRRTNDVKFITVLVFILSLVANVLCQNSPCTQDGPCKCTFSDGVIDLSPLTPSNTEPKWKDVAPTNGGNYRYSFSPCKDFTETDSSPPFIDDCHDVASCQKDPSFNSYYSCGRQKSAKFIEEDGKVKLSFKETTTNPERYTEVTLVCSPTESFVVQGEKQGSSPPVFEYTLSSPHACKRGAGGGGGSSISIGTILCIVLLGLIIVYLVGGLVFMGAVKKTRGVEMIPNVSFWKSLPGYVKDGFCFTISPITKKSEYGKI